MRDSAWKGPSDPKTGKALFDPIAGRGAFAEAFIADCRRKGLHAVAITDHHDLCLYKEIRDAAAREKDAEGHTYETASQVVVFPGIELTLATPSCQALLIFDSSLPDQILNLVWGALRLAPAPDHSEKTTTTQALHTDLSLGEISNSLSAIRTNPEETSPAKFETFAGRFILLPNVKKGGHKSIIRDGFQAHFIAMPCVGGYIEGCLYSELEGGNRAKIEGRILEWGGKPLGVFQTSDCRAAAAAEKNGKTEVSFSELAKWPTWVKWSEPSAEALRQACLARKSRITHTEPAYPNSQIAGVVVSDSAFLGPIELGLNPQFNAFIGGRGTGKSSLLEYIRWALCDDPLPPGDAVELPNFQQRRKALVEGSLRTQKAKITVFYRKNGVLYRIERALIDKGDTITVFDGAEVGKAMTPQQVRAEFPIVSYAQKQLSCVGTLPEEINRLVTAPVQVKVAGFQHKIGYEIIPKLKQQRSSEVRVALLNASILESETANANRKQQVLALQSQLNALTPEQQAVVQAHDALSTQDQSIALILRMPTNVANSLKEARTKIDAMGTALIAKDSPAANRLEPVANEVNAFVARVRDQLNAFAAEAETAAFLSAATRTVLEEVRSAYAAHAAEYANCISASAKNKAQLDEIQSLNAAMAAAEVRLAADRTERDGLQATLNEMKDSNWLELLGALEERAALLRGQCETVNDQAQHEFKASLAFCGTPTPVLAAMDAVIQGKNVKDGESKVSAIGELVCSSAHPVKKWAELMTELDGLFASKGLDGLPACPLLQSAGFSPLNLNSIRNALSRDFLEQIRFFDIEDRIEFTFRMGKKADHTDNYIPFITASPGQQATCLLRTLLAQSGAPLLIDQPEEDLDNEQVQILSDRIAETKHNRQLIFVSHNANIVVNGDAELVVGFGYRDPADNSKGKIVTLGSIDSREVRNRITSVMEGGREAFNLRRSKYGF